MRTNAHILIDQTVFPDIPPMDLEINLLESDKLNIDKQEHGVSAFASLEWAIPSIIFAYFTKPYFDGFLNEMGAEHYQKVQTWLLLLNKKFKAETAVRMSKSKSNEKIKESNSPNNFFSIYLTTPKGIHMKVFMPNCELEKEDVKALSTLLDNFLKLYTKPKSKFAQKINGLADKVYEELYAVFNVEKGDWEFYTTDMLVKKSINLNKIK